MVVGDDQLEPDAAGKSGFMDRGDAAVDADDELAAVAVDLTQGVGVDAVALFEPVGDVVADVRPGELEQVPEDGGGGDPVHIVIAVDDDVFCVAEGGRPGGRRRCIPGATGVERFQFRVEEAAGGVTLGDAAVVQKLGEEAGGMEAACGIGAAVPRRGDHPSPGHPCRDLLIRSPTCASRHRAASSCFRNRRDPASGQASRRLRRRATLAACSSSIYRLEPRKRNSETMSFRGGCLPRIKTDAPNPFHCPLGLAHRSALHAQESSYLHGIHDANPNPQHCLEHFTSGGSPAG